MVSHVYRNKREEIIERRVGVKSGNSTLIRQISSYLKWMVRIFWPCSLCYYVTDITGTRRIIQIFAMEEFEFLGIDIKINTQYVSLYF